MKISFGFASNVHWNHEESVKPVFPFHLCFQAVAKTKAGKMGARYHVHQCWLVYRTTQVNDYHVFASRKLGQGPETPHHEFQSDLWPTFHAPLARNTARFWRDQLARSEEMRRKVGTSWFRVENHEIHLESKRVIPAIVFDADAQASLDPSGQCETLWDAQLVSAVQAKPGATFEERDSKSVKPCKNCHQTRLD